jgi:hypothetical protein
MRFCPADDSPCPINLNPHTLFLAEVYGKTDHARYADPFPKNPLIMTSCFLLFAGVLFLFHHFIRILLQFLEHDI